MRLSLTVGGGAAIVERPRPSLIETKRLPFFRLLHIPTAQRRGELIGGPPVNWIKTAIRLNYVHREASDDAAPTCRRASPLATASGPQRAARRVGRSRPEGALCPARLPTPDSHNNTSKKSARQRMDKGASCSLHTQSSVCWRTVRWGSIKKIDRQN